MTKRRFGFLLLMVLVLVLLGAGGDRLRGEVGIKVGLSISGFHNCDDYRTYLGYEIDWLQARGNNRPIFGMQVGIFKTFKLTRHFLFQPEIHYALRGMDFSRSYLYDTMIFKVKIHYLEFPLLLKYRFSAFQGFFKPALYVGPYGALKLSAKKSTRFDQEAATATLPNVNGGDLGLVAGASADFDFRDFRLLLDLRFQMGLTSIMSLPKDFVAPYDHQGTVKNTTLSLLVGIGFDLW